MATFLDDVIRLVSGEKQHSDAINNCFIYFQALAETRNRGVASDLFDCLPAGWPVECNDATALRLHNIIADFIEKCPNHPNVGSAFHILLRLNVGDDLKGYFITKLRYYYAQGNAHVVYHLCQVIELSGMNVFLEKNGDFMQSRSLYEGEINLRVARRFLNHLKENANNPK